MTVAHRDFEKIYRLDLVIGDAFLLPIIAQLLGTPGVALTPRTARLGADLKANDQREDYLRCRLESQKDGGLTALPFSKQDSSMMATLKDADGLLIRAPHAPAATIGEHCSVLVLRDFLGRSL